MSRRIDKLQINALNASNNSVLVVRSGQLDYEDLDNLTTSVSNNLILDTVTANSFASAGFGVPTIESATNIVLSANGINGGAVVIQDSALRLRSYDDGAVANLTASAGDMIFNSSNSRIQFYDGNAWLTLSVS
jgi:hypothetical protein